MKTRSTRIGLSLLMISALASLACQDSESYTRVKENEDPERTGLYQALASESKANHDMIRQQLAHHPAFRDAQFPSIVDIKSVLTGQSFAHEVKITREGQPAGFAIVALQDQRLRLHSYAREGNTLIEELLAQADGNESPKVEIFQEGLFNYVAVDSMRQKVFATSAYHLPSSEQWNQYVQAVRSRGYCSAEQTDNWDLIEASDQSESPGEKKCKKQSREEQLHVVGDRNTPLWHQFMTRHYGGYCAVGCGPMAFAMYMAWAEKTWSGVNFFDGDSYRPRPKDKNDAGDLTKAIGDHLGTFCIAGQGATAYYPRRKKFRRKVNAMLNDLNRGSHRLAANIHYASKSTDLHEILVRELRPKALGGKDRPAIIFGWSPFHDPNAGIFENIERQHIYLIDGVVESASSSAECANARVRSFRVNLGYSQKKKSRRFAGRWLVEKNAKAVGTIRHYNN